MYISPEEYSCDRVFASELENIFHRRLFVASSGRLSSENSYRAYLAGTRALVTRYSEGSYRTFDNVCLRRGNLLYPIGYNAAPFRCAYHGWAYESSGMLRQTPLCDLNGISTKQLESFLTANLNQLLFTDLRGCDPELSGPHKALDAIGYDLEHGAVPFYNSTMPHDANWKLLVENVVEAYHVSFLHGPTLVKQGYSSAGDICYGSYRDCSWHTITPKDALDMRIRRLLPDYKRWYAHAYIPPNLFVAVTDGLIVYIGHFLPTNAHTTILEYELFETPRLASTTPAIRRYFKENAVRFCIATLEEDRTVLSTTHQGLRFKRKPLQIQGIEPRVTHFHQYYREVMDGV